MSLQAGRHFCCKSEQKDKRATFKMSPVRYCHAEAVRVKENTYLVCVA